MSSLEVWNMALSQERELDHGHKRQVRDRQRQEAIERVRRPATAIHVWSRRLWHAATGLQRPRASGTVSITSYGVEPPRMR